MGRRHPSCAMHRCSLLRVVSRHRRDPISTYVASLKSPSVPVRGNGHLIRCDQLVRQQLFVNDSIEIVCNSQAEQVRRIAHRICCKAAARLKVVKASTKRLQISALQCNTLAPF